MEKEDIFKKLNDFNKNAEELFAHSFIKKLQNTGVSINWERDKGTSVQLRSPDEESIKAVVNDIRKFLQKNDSLKIDKLQNVYKSKNVDKSEKDEYVNILKEREEFENSFAMLTVNSISLKVIDVFNVFLYGKYAHRSEGTKDIHDEWESIPVLYELMKNEFIRALHVYIQLISNIVCINKIVIAKLENDAQV
ncbi:MAG: hypothetical protein WC490_00195 [Candidatus Margulisiibacteriota bacterium]